MSESIQVLSRSLKYQKLFVFFSNRKFNSSIKSKIDLINEASSLLFKKQKEE